MSRMIGIPENQPMSISVARHNEIVQQADDETEETK